MNPELYNSDQFDKTEQEISGRAAFGRLLPFLYERRRALLACLALLAATTALSLVWPSLLQQAIDGPLKSGNRRSLLEFALIIAAVQIVTTAMLYLLRIWLETIGQDIMLSLKQQLFMHVLSLEIAFFDRNPVGRLMARVESDTESLRLLFTNTVLLVIGDLLLLSGIYAVLFYYNWRLASILLISVPIIGLLIYIFHRLTTRRFFEVRKRMAEVTATLTEFLHGMSIIQIFHRGDYARRRVNRANSEKFSEDAYVNVAVVLFFNIVFLFEYIKIGLVVLLGPGWGLTSGETVMFLVLIWRSFEPIFRTSEQLSNFQKGIAGSRRIFALLNTEPKLTEPIHPVAWPGLKRAIRFENVWFSYNNDDNYALKDVSFALPVGDRVALVGVTGGGKSTVISLLQRFYDPQRGRITIDGVDIRTLPTSELRRRFALVLQDIFLFPGDVADNISLESSDISQDRIIEAARTVSANKFIDRLPHGMQTLVSERGANFSRGERQLLAFARALAFDPEVLILDEATSSVDPETERYVQNSLKKLMQGRTALIIAHRLSTILDVDQILVIKKGEIIERGTHTELILADGYYSRLFHLQFKYRTGAASNV